MTDLVLDTHTLVWYLQKSPKLTDPARTAIKSSISAGKFIHISPISLVEMLFLEEKGKLPLGTLQMTLTEIERPDHVLIEAPFVAAMMEAMVRIPRNIVPELPDRIIAATALHLGIPLVTADREIRAANVVTIW